MDLKDIDKLAELARLEIPQEEKESVLNDLSSVLAYVGQIQYVAIADINPDYQLRNVAREDENPTASGTYAVEIIREMPDSQDGFLKVKKIL